MIRTYSQLMSIPTYKERYEYLRLPGTVGKQTFGFDRVFNQQFYTSEEWRRFRNKIIARDLGHDLGMPGEEYEIKGVIYIHHMNPISIKDLREHSEFLLNEEYMICTSHATHNAIHYGTFAEALQYALTERSKNDTCPWKK